MPRFRQTSELLRLMKKKENIRNVGIIAHIDHGKTTMSDSLLAQAGLLPPHLAGTVRVLDYLEEEQRRGITIKTANISLLYETEGDSYVINLVDTPGHVDFSGKVTRALRAIDGAIVVVDAVEEIMPQTVTVTRQALEERVKPVLFINKVDRLINELKLTNDEIQEKFLRIIRDFNSLIEAYGEEEFKKGWKVKAEKDGVAFGSALHGWGFTINIAKQKQVKFTDIIEIYRKERSQTLAKLIPLSHAVLEMVVKNAPDPVTSQRYRVPKIWKGEIASDIGRAMLNCEEEGPTVMCITAAQELQEVGLVATGRIFSGSLRKDRQVYLVNAREVQNVEDVAIYMGAFREIVDQIGAGNIAAVAGLQRARAGETIVDPTCMQVMVPFEPLRYVSQKVMTVAIEPRNPENLPEVVKALDRLMIEDPNLEVNMNEETGEYLLSGMGELHLEVATELLKKHLAGTEVFTSSPIVVYREIIRRKGKRAMAKSQNERNKFEIQVEPLEELTAEIIEKNGTLKTSDALAVDRNGNVLVSLTSSSGFPDQTLKAVISSFRRTCMSGPLCGEPLRGVKVKLLDAKFATESILHVSEQIVPAVRRAIWASFLTAKPSLVEPVYKVEVSVPSELSGKCFNILARRRGKIVSSEQKPFATVIVAYVPVRETFKLSEEMRTATSGYAFWQSVFDHWEAIPANIKVKVVKELRARKGLPSEIPKPERLAELVG